MRRNVEQAFTSDIREHELHVLRDDGLYRHVRCMRPGTYCFGFDIVTWPGYLAYVGDMGTFVFSRIRDMFEFFDSGAERHRINPDYWSEKLQGGGERPAMEFSEDAYTRAVREWRDHVIEDTLLGRYATDCEHHGAWLGLGCSPPYTAARGKLALEWSIGTDPYEVVPLSGLAKIDDFKYEVEWQLLRSEVYSEERAYHLLSEFEWKDSYDDKDPIEIHDAWDTLGSFREFEFRFLWCCHALVWAIAKYKEQAREPVAA